jgi:Domain of unknown function (DUF4145)
VSEKYFPPTFDQGSFHCPFCQVYAAQVWYSGAGRGRGGQSFADFKQLSISLCTHCRSTAFWVDGVRVHPTVNAAPPANPDLPANVQADYAEAAAVASRSPRAAAALLRLCIQNLCVHLGLPGANINSDIGELVSRGLDPDVQMALDALRVIGNNAVHPLELDLRDDHATATALFEAVNFIAEQMITNRKKVKALFAKLPEGAKEAIKKRDS